MNALLTGLRGLLTAVGTGAIVLGALSLSLSEGMMLTIPAATIQPTALVNNFTPQLESTTSPTGTAAPHVLVTATLAAPTTCPPPTDWIAYVVQPGDTVEILAARSGLTVATLKEGNCLVSSQLMSGTFIFLPPTQALATLTATRIFTPVNPIVYASPVPCGPPSRWVRYIVRSGDTLFLLSRVLGVSVNQLQHANCMGKSTLIRAGEALWVPFLPPAPSATSSATSTRTAVPTQVIPTTSPSPSATQVPTTAVPTTAVPTTSVPTTAVPTTQVPSVEPTTAVPSPTEITPTETTPPPG